MTIQLYSLCDVNARIQTDIASPSRRSQSAFYRDHSIFVSLCNARNRWTLAIGNARDNLVQFNQRYWRSVQPTRAKLDGIETDANGESVNNGEGQLNLE